MALSSAVRAAKFARYVEQLMQEARKRDMTVADIEKATGVSKATFYRWKNAEWTKDPRGSQVKAFCEGLGGSYERAYRLLGWSEMGSPETEPAIDLEPDMKAVARRLRDPNVSEAEKQEIRAMIRYLARRQREDQDD